MSEFERRITEARRASREIADEVKRQIDAARVGRAPAPAKPRGEPIAAAGAPEGRPEPES